MLYTTESDRHEITKGQKKHYLILEHRPLGIRIQNIPNHGTQTGHLSR